MHCLFEESDALNTPIECFLFDASKEIFPVKPHWHYFMELICMTEGNAEMFADGERFLLSPGDMILFHPMTVHSICSSDGNPPVYRALKLDINCMGITPSYAPKLRSIFKHARKKAMNIFFSADDPASFYASEILKTCIEETDRKDYGFDLIVKTEIYKLLIEIIRSWKRNGFIVDNEAYAEDSRYDIYNITEYIDTNMDSNIKVADIAAKCGMSYSYFAKRFLSVYGKTCKEYIDTMRIFKAEEFLVFTDFNLNYISQETGYSDCSHLIKSFKQFKGVTPKQFRLLHNKMTSDKK